MFPHFPDTEKPYVESIGGRREAKMSSGRTHARLQGRLWAWPDTWAADRGEAATEWRFYLLGRSRPSSLVPDVAYVSLARLPRSLPDDARERPRLAPDIAVEIWSPGDRAKALQEKIDPYLSNGTSVVIVVYAEERKLTIHRSTRVSVQPARGTLSVPGYGDLVLDADALFEGL
jgi:Uma2 family endonuclease